MYFIYGADGSVIGFEYNGDKYYYAKNIQGDIIYICNEYGAKLVTYSYDPWGVCTIVSDTSGIGLGTMNPFRYRSYYYDQESGFYYLNSRYYDPEVGRFINADGYISTGDGILDKNMFAYCGNNPVQYADPIGTHAVAIGIGISAFMVGGFTYSVSISFDFHGNIALQLTKADVFQDKTGAVVGFASAGTSVNFSYNTADTVNNLEGITYNYGGSGNVYGPVTV